MSFPLLTVVSIIVGVAAVVVTLVGPLYYIVLDMSGDDAAAEEERGTLGETQDSIKKDISDLREELQVSHDDLRDEVQELRTDVHENALRAEQNQKHIHQLLVGDHNGDEGEMGNPHHKAEYCPLPEECPWHEATE